MLYIILVSLQCVRLYNGEGENDLYGKYDEYILFYILALQDFKLRVTNQMKNTSVGSL